MGTPLGQLIESAREAVGLYQRDAATQLNFTPARWRDIITGRAGNVRPETLARMCEVVGLAPRNVSRVRPDVAVDMVIRVAEGTDAVVLRPQVVDPLIEALARTLGPQKIVDMVTRAATS